MLHAWQVEEASFERLCVSKNILTVNKEFSGPTIYAHEGETIIVDIENQGKDNITISWYKLTSFSTSISFFLLDLYSYVYINYYSSNLILFCTIVFIRYGDRHFKSDPQSKLTWLIQSGTSIRRNIACSSDAYGTLWWPAKDIWQSATVHGALIVYPSRPVLLILFPEHDAEIPIILSTNIYILLVM